MAQRYNNLPTFDQAVQEKGVTSKVWFFFWQALWNGIAPSAESAVALSTSPFTFTAPRGGFLIVQGGTVSFVSFSRDGSTFHNTGQTQGIFPVSKQDQIVITYSVAPTLTFVPT